jgi:hypothetical protein
LLRNLLMNYSRTLGLRQETMLMFKLPTPVLMEALPGVPQRLVMSGGLAINPIAVSL